MLKIENDKKNTYIILGVIVSISFFIKLIYLEWDQPLILDGLKNFLYSSAINFHGYLPQDWSPTNNGWPIFVAIIFALFDFNTTLDYMNLQRLISITLSCLVIIPTFFLCKRFFDNKISLISSMILAFEPRLIINSVLGITEPLFMLLGISSLVILLKNSKINIIISFILVSFCTIVRSEGIFLFFSLIIILIIKNKLKFDLFKILIPSILIFALIITPISIYKNEVNGNDGIFQRVTTESNDIIFSSDNSSKYQFELGIELFIKYLGWIMIPIFILFLPIGLFLKVFRIRNKDTDFLYIILIVFLFPIFYAYYMNAQDTRYFYFLYPIFCLISCFTIQKIYEKIKNKKFHLIFSIIFAITIFSSAIIFIENFYDEFFIIENENFKISKLVSEKISGVNHGNSLIWYLNTNKIPEKWPFKFKIDNYDIFVKKSDGSNNIVDYIKSSNGQLSHLIIYDNNEEKFFNDLFINEQKYPFLNKIFDSHDYQFSQDVKIFKINYEEFEKFLIN